MSFTDIKWAGLRWVRARGWEVRPFDAYLRLADYLHHVLFPALGINCVIDVGARVGDYGRDLRHSGYRGDIVSFEPVSASFRRLSECTSGDPRWKAFQVALGADAAMAEINVMEGTQFSSFRRPSRYGADAFGRWGNVIQHTEQVPVRRLDALFPELTGHLGDPRVYLKLDTQGWDLEVLKGASGCLNHVVALQSELSLQEVYEGQPDWLTSLRAFQDAGFFISALYPVAQDEDLLLAEFDCIMVRRWKKEEASSG